MRPLWFDFPDDTTAWTVDDQYLFGPFRACRACHQLRRPVSTAIPPRRGGVDGRVQLRGTQWRPMGHRCRTAPTHTRIFSRWSGGAPVALPVTSKLRRRLNRFRRTVDRSVVVERGTSRRTTLRAHTYACQLPGILRRPHVLAQVCLTTRPKEVIADGIHQQRSTGPPRRSSRETYSCCRGRMQPDVRADQHASRRVHDGTGPKRDAHDERVHLYHACHAARHRRFREAQPGRDDQGGQRCQYASYLCPAAPDRTARR